MQPAGLYTVSPANSVSGRLHRLLKRGNNKHILYEYWVAYTQGRQRRGMGDASPTFWQGGCNASHPPLLRRTCINHHNVTFN